MRLDLFLLQSGAAPTRSQAKAWIDAGRVVVDGKMRKAGFELGGGESITIDEPEAAEGTPQPEDLPLTILYEDEEVVAIDKPPGIVVHPAPGAWHGTIVNALLHRNLVDHDAGDERPGIVHRLDKETSGVLLVARTAVSHAALARAFHDRLVHKTYFAVVLGTPRAATGTIEWSIGRHPHERKRMSIRSRSPRAASTRYPVVESFGARSLVRAEPETGRTHQIRVHLAALGHAVLADPLYGSRKGRALPASGPARSFGRQALHAASIEFPHPTSGSKVRVESALPDDFTELLECLRERKTSG